MTSSASNTPETTPSLDYDGLNNVPILNYFDDDYVHLKPIICMMLKKMVKLRQYVHAINDEWRNK